MDNFNEVLSNYAQRWTNQAEAESKAAQDILDDAQDRVSRMVGPTEQTVAQIRDAAEARSRQAFERSQDYAELATGALEGRFDIPRRLYSNGDFAREYREVITQGTVQKRLRIVD
jgi:vacuolar-type H+-ATPase subunit E/Vma4